MQRKVQGDNLKHIECRDIRLFALTSEFGDDAL